MEELLASLIKKHKGDDKFISMGTTLEELEYESFSFIELVLLIEDELDIEFDDQFLSYREFETVGDVLAYSEICVAKLQRTSTAGR